MNPLEAPKMSIRESLASLTTVATSKVSLSTRPSSAGSFSSHRTSLTSYNGSFSYIPSEDAPKLIRTPWEADRSRRLRHRSGSVKTLPARFFQELPVEIYECILEQLGRSHFSETAGTCTACYLKDFSNLALTSKAWERSARRQLYVPGDYIVKICD
jgi:hypothetical protein